MPAAVSQSIRQALWAASQQGLSTSELVERFDLPDRTVRHLLKLGRDNGGQVPSASYHSFGTRDPASAGDVFRTALELKALHPDWGARFVLGVLAKTLPGQPLPNERTLRRWFRNDDQPVAPAGRRRERLARAQAPHGRWQVDACDQMPLATGEQISWLRGVDECTGTVLGTAVFPPGAIQPGASRADSGTLPYLVRAVGIA